MAIQSFSKYERTNNKALDLVAEAVGWAQEFNKPVVSITLSRQYYALYMAGTEILRQEFLPNMHKLEFEGVPVLQGSMHQIDSLTIQYRNMVGDYKLPTPIHN